MRFVMMAVLIAAFTGLVMAGPPLVCWGIEIGNAKSLPWKTGVLDGNGTLPDYRIEKLADDTLALLSPDIPVIVRMETLHRAALYAAKNEAAGKELLSRVITRAKDLDSRGKSDGLAWFDAGYLAEAYRQAEGSEMHVVERILDTLGLREEGSALKLTGGKAGYEWVKKALAIRGNDPEMEYAAALITWHPRSADHEGHLAKAAEGAREGSLLEKNMVRHFNHLGRNITELRSNVGAQKR